MNAIILEDNLADTWDYEMILDELGITVKGTYKSWKEALPELKKAMPDFMIVDLFLSNNEKGLDFIELIKDYFIPIIVCSGYPEKNYMDEALDAGVFAFISKPIDKAAFTYQVKKLVKQISADNYKKNHLIIKDKRNILKIPYNQIIKIEIEGNYSYIYLDSGKKYIQKLSLKKITEKLDAKTFIRCYRSIIVNLYHVKSLDTIENKLSLSNGMSIHVGTKYRSAVRIAFLQD